MFKMSKLIDISKSTVVENVLKHVYEETLKTTLSQLKKSSFFFFNFVRFISSSTFSLVLIPSIVILWIKIVSMEYYLDNTDSKDPFFKYVYRRSFNPLLYALVIPYMFFAVVSILSSFGSNFFTILEENRVVQVLEKRIDLTVSDTVDTVAYNLLSDLRKGLRKTSGVIENLNADDITNAMQQ